MTDTIGNITVNYRNPRNLSGVRADLVSSPGAAEAPDSATNSTSTGSRVWGADLPAALMLVSYGAKWTGTSFSRPLSSLVEHFLGKEEVVGPIPTGGSQPRSSERMPRG